MVWNLLHPCRLDGLETRLSINPFDDGSGRFFVLINFVLINDEKQHEMMGGRK
jgi:hypothetical protein